MVKRVLRAKQKKFSQNDMKKTETRKASQLLKNKRILIGINDHIKDKLKERLGLSPQGFFDLKIDEYFADIEFEVVTSIEERKKKNK